MRTAAAEESAWGITSVKALCGCLKASPGRTETSCGADLMLSWFSFSEVVDAILDLRNGSLCLSGSFYNSSKFPKLIPSNCSSITYYMLCKVLLYTVYLRLLSILIIPHFLILFRSERKKKKHGIFINTWQTEGINEQNLAKTSCKKQKQQWTLHQLRITFASRSQIRFTVSSGWLCSRSTKGIFIIFSRKLWP